MIHIYTWIRIAAAGLSLVRKEQYCAQIAMDQLTKIR